MLALVALALAARILVPAGWMPSADSGMPTITLCTGSGMVTAWIDADGKIHKSAPESGGKASGACVFAFLGLALTGIALGFALAWFHHRLPTRRLAEGFAAVGRGLAAPPPPARGPPLTA